jgi:hypothetical protein
MGNPWRPASALVVLALLAAAMPDPAESRSQNTCDDCHQNYNMYLDILEDDPQTSVPAVLGDGQTLTVTVAIKVTSNTPEYKVMSSITATLGSRNGLFAVVSPLCTVGALSKGQTALATWQIRPMASGNDVMLISARGVNQHGPTYYADTYSPAPSIAVTKAGIDLAPTISITEPPAGARLTAGAPANVSWAVTDEDVRNCTVSLFYSTDGFAAVNQSVAAGIPAGRAYEWTVPLVDAPEARLKALIIDPKGNFNESVQPGPFGIDAVPPAVLSVLPAEGADGLSDSALLRVRFSEPVNESSASGAFSISPDPGGLAWHWNAESTVMTSAHAPYRAATTYKCTLGPGVRDTSMPGNVNGSARSWSFTTPEHFVPTPSALVSDPSGGERYHWGDRLNITWSASGGAGGLLIGLFISENGSDGPFLPLAEGQPNTGWFDIPVPELVSDRCLVELSATDQNGTEARVPGGQFSVARNLTISAEMPPAGAAFAAGNSTQVFWNVSGGHGAVTVDLFYVPYANATSQVVQKDMPRAGSRRWIAPEEDRDGARLVLNATDDWGRHVEAASGPLRVFSKDRPGPSGPNRPPVVVLSAGAGTARLGDLVTFDASGSFDPDGDALSYVWYFGDGTAVINTTGPVVSHVYSVGGELPFSVTASDGKDRTVQLFAIHVEARPAAAEGTGSGPAGIVGGAVVILLGCAGVGWALRPQRPAPAAPGSAPSGGKGGP